MVNDLKVKRLLKQAGVSVLAGFVMSSAVMAEDINTDAGEPVEVSVEFEGFEPEVMVDPMPSEEGVGPEGEIAIGEPVSEPDIVVDGIDAVGGDVDTGVLDGDMDVVCANCSADVGVVPEPMPLEGVATATSVDAVADLGPGVTAAAENRNSTGDHQNDWAVERGERGQSGGVPKFLLR